MKVLRNIIVTLAVILIIGFLCIHIALDGMFTGPFYDKNDLIENYEKKKDEIEDASNYFKSIMPKETYVHIEFENNRELGIFHIEAKRPYESNWNLKINSSKTDSLLQELNWTKKQLMTLKNKLDRANCISIGGNEKVSIGWQRSGMGMFSYIFFETNLTDREIEANDGGCTHIFYKDNIVLTYGGGAIGPQCFPDSNSKNE